MIANFIRRIGAAPVITAAAQKVVPAGAYGTGGYNTSIAGAIAPSAHNTPLTVQRQTAIQPIRFQGHY